MQKSKLQNFIVDFSTAVKNHDPTTEDKEEEYFGLPNLN